MQAERTPPQSRNVAYKATFTVKNYPASSFAERIVWACSCGKTGTVEDGANGVTMKRARAAHARHARRDHA